MVKSKLTQDQKREIGLLVNAGVSRELLAKDYRVSICTINKISTERKQWLERKWLAGKKGEKRFRYAQKIYPQLNSQLQKYIFGPVYKPIIDRIQKYLVGECPERLFVKAVLGPRSLPKIDKKAVADYSAIIRKLALVIINEDTDKKVIYNNHRYAVIGIGDMIADLEEASWGARTRKDKEQLRKGINQVLRMLPSKKRKIVRLRYGLGDGRIRILNEVAGPAHLTMERVRQIQGEAIKELHNPKTEDQLRQLVNLPAFRQCVQRPRYHSQIATI